MSTVKNWEAQAKTNSILASSLKALEQRVDDLATLMEWRMDVDARFDEIALTFSEMTDTIEDFKEEVATNNMNFKMELDKVEKGGFIGGKSMFTSRFTMKSRKSFAAPKKAGDSQALVVGDDDGPSQQIQMPMKQLFPTKQDIRTKIKEDWQQLIILAFLGVQVLVCLPFLAEVFIAADITARFISGILGLSLLASSATGCYAAFSDHKANDYPARKAALLAFLALQSWVIAMGAIYMQSSAREAVKLEQYCEIDAWSSLTLGQDSQSGCTRDRRWAQVKVLLGMGAVLTGLMLSWAFMALRAQLDEAQLAAKIPGIVMPILRKARMPRGKGAAGSMFASGAVNASNRSMGRGKSTFNLPGSTSQEALPDRTRSIKFSNDML